MKVPISKIASLVQGNIIGDSNTLISGVAPFELAGENDITVAGNAKLLKKMGDCQAAAIIVPRNTKPGTNNLVEVDNPMVAFAKALQYFHPPHQPEAGIHPGAEIGKEFKCGPNVAIGPKAVIGRQVTIGDGVWLHPGVVIGDKVVIGDDVVGIGS